MDDPRRRIPRTDALLALPEVQRAAAAVGARVVAGVVRATQDRARRGELAPEDVAAAVIDAVTRARPASLRPVLNATGVIVHTNLGRAPLSPAARAAVQDAAGYVDLELDLTIGARSRRGAGMRAALLRACPGAEDALVVNNAAAALVLATTALAGTARAAAPSQVPTHAAESDAGEPAGEAVELIGGREVVMSRGEFIEIGAGFRLSDLIASTGARIHEIGTTNRTHLADYAEAIGPTTGAVLKIHTSNYAVIGFTAEVPVRELAALCRERDVPLIADLGSGLLAPDPVLPDEPDAATALADGADLVIASGDKLLGGPQAGIILGRADLVATIARHPLARAVRADKLTLAALEATVSAGTSPVREALHADADRLRLRTERLARAVGGRVVAHDGRVGGGGGVEVPLAGWAVALPETLAAPLRLGSPAVLPRVADGACLVDLRCVPDDEDERLEAAILAARDAAGAAVQDGAPFPSGHADVEESAVTPDAPAFAAAPESTTAPGPSRAPEPHDRPASHNADAPSAPAFPAASTPRDRSDSNGADTPPASGAEA